MFLLGIYEDTHCLTNLATTPRDMQAAWLLEQGEGCLRSASMIFPLLPSNGFVAALLGEARLEKINQRSILVMAASA